MNGCFYQFEFCEEASKRLQFWLRSSPETWPYFDENSHLFKKSQHHIQRSAKLERSKMLFTLKLYLPFFSTIHLHGIEIR